jgi:hypothetical protein
VIGGGNRAFIRQAEANHRYDLADEFDVEAAGVRMMRSINPNPSFPLRCTSTH